MTGRRHKHIATWPLTTRPIWLQSAKPYLSYSSATNFDPHESRATNLAGPPPQSVQLVCTQNLLKWFTPQQNRENRMHSFGDALLVSTRQNINHGITRKWLHFEIILLTLSTDLMQFRAN